MIYLDYNATTPVDEEVLDAMLPYFRQQFANAASQTHALGWVAAEAVQIAREQVAALIGAQPGEIVFTSGATESINLALKGAYEMYASRGQHIISAPTEHKAVLDTLVHLEKKGAQISWLSLDHLGRIDIEELSSLIRADTLLVALMWANNETGLIQDMEAVAKLCYERKLLLFTDATQAVGKVDVDVSQIPVSMLSLSAHKMYGPKGVGALFVRQKSPKLKLSAQIDGGGHESGFRSGTLNVPGIVGLGKAAALAKSRLSAQMNHLSALRDKLEQGILAMEGAHVHCMQAPRLPNTSNVRFDFVEGSKLMTHCHKKLAMAAGSACTSASLTPSHVLSAMGLPQMDALGALRISLGKYTTAQEIDQTLALISDAVKHLRTQNPLYHMRP